MNDLLAPQKAIILAGRHFRRQAGRLETTCPTCSNAMWVIGHSFVCPGESCSFGRGSSLDFLAAETGSYEAAIEAAAEEIPYYREAGRVEAARHEAKRRLLEFAFQAEQLNHDLARDRVIFRNSFASRAGIPSSAFKRGHWYLSATQSDQLVLLLATMGYTPPSNLQGRAVAVAPFWADLHTLSALYVSHEGRSVQSCELEPAKVSFFGLQQMTADNREVMIFPSYRDAMLREEYFDVCDASCFPTSLHINPKAGRRGITFERLRFFATLDDYLFFLPRWALIEGFEAGRFELPDLPAVGLEDLLGELMQHCALRPLDFTDMCAATTFSPRLRASLLEMTETMPDQRFARHIKNTLARKLLTIDDKGAVYECPDGYHAVTGATLRRTTNFTIELEKMICFSSLTEARYVGKVRLGNIELPLDVTSSKLENNRQLEEIIRSAQTLSGLSLDAGGTATIFQDRDFRRVMETLRTRRAELPSFVGVSSLGWNHRFDTFFMPNAIVDRQGVRGGVSYHADPAGDHHCYTSEVPVPLSLPEAIAPVDPVLAELVSCVVAQVVRFFHAKPVRLWPVRNNEGREKALRLFHGLGQETVMRLTHFVPRNFDLNKGLPCLVALQGELQASKAKLAGLYLSERGADLTKVDDEQVDRLSQLLPGLVVEIARRLITGEKVSYKERRSVDPMSAVALEGAELIRSDFWENWPQAGARWNAINTLLDKKEEVIPQRVVLDNAKGTLMFPKILWADLDINPVDLTIEMGLMNLKAEMKEEGIVVDKATMDLVFTDFYGEVPRLLSV